MQVVINPKDKNTFATASLDRTIKVWQLGSSRPQFTLVGHKKGVNCIDYYRGDDKPYLISGADDHLVKIWNYQNQTCVATLDGHEKNISAVCFHPVHQFILTGSIDSTVRIWHANTYRLEKILDYGMKRVRIINAFKGGNTVAIGYEEGSIIIQLGREKPVISMDDSGQILWAEHSELYQANLKVFGTDADIKDGDRLSLSLSVKEDLGACEFCPDTIQHNPNGRFVVVCGDGEYIIYTAMALRNKASGSAVEFVWAADSNVYAVRESASNVKVFKNFKEFKSLKPDYILEGICGGAMLGMRSTNSLCFYDWETLRMIRRIEIIPKQVFWSENGELVTITTHDSFFILKYNAEVVASTPEGSAKVSEDGIDDAFDDFGEVSDTVKTGTWIGNCFVYTTADNLLNYFVGGKSVTVAHLDQPMYLLGYIPTENRLYLSDKDLTVVSYAIFGKGLRQQALAVSQDSEHRFELALALGELKVAYELAAEADSEEKWRQLSQAATLRSELNLACECLVRAKDYDGLLFLGNSARSPVLMNKLTVDSSQAGQNNVAFPSNFSTGTLETLLKEMIDMKKEIRALNSTVGALNS